MDFATVYLKGTGYGGITNQEGIYHVSAPAGDYTLVVSAVGYKTVEKPVTLVRGQRVRQNVTITPETQQLDEVTVVSTGVSRVKRSAFNAVAVDTKELQNTTRNLSDALTKAPGMKLRESGGVGSDMQLMLDGFSGKHVKVFIDGVPQEGVGSSFALNNIPVNFADRIEVYKGVVPVGFGTDAIGGVINIVTNKKRRRWFLDASYSYGSFNTHKSNVHFGQTFKNGFTYEINAFQNYSDNDYRIDSPVEDFETGRIDRDKKVRVRRFNDTYHNEAVIGKVGVIDKKWADRLMFGFTYSNMYQDVQTGVRQDIVYGQKHRKGHSLMPSLEYNKRNLFAKGLDVVLTVNYNKNLTTNVDTASYKYNWYGERKPLNQLPPRQGAHADVQPRAECFQPFQYFIACQRRAVGCHCQRDPQEYLRSLLPPDAVRRLELIRIRQVLQPVCRRTCGYGCQSERLCTHHPQRTFRRLWSGGHLLHPAGTASQAVL